MVRPNEEEGGRDNEAVRLTDTRQLSQQIDQLKDELGKSPSFENYAELARLSMLAERYEEATRAYDSALELQPGETNLQRMRAMAHSNAVAELDVRVPEPSFFDRNDLLKAASDSGVGLPDPLPARPVGITARILRIVGNLLGALATVLLNLLMRTTGRVLGYRGSVWTNWYERRYLVGVLLLGYMREKLNSNNLKDVYPRDTLVGFQESGQSPPPGVKHFRTEDGTWNNLSNPKEGAAGTRFHRNVADSAVGAGDQSSLMHPNPREISQKLLARDAEMKSVPFLNMFAASWINFQNHDWVHHGDILMDDVHEIPLAQDDPARIDFGQTHIAVGKTQPDPTRHSTGEHTPLTFINEVTHWWDGSQVYGSNKATTDALRSGSEGKINVTEEGTLPLDEKGIEQTGFTRNWWIGLSMLHTLFTREHNAICDQLVARYPDWDDNRLFNVARLINAAVMAKIHSIEWTPAILPNRGLDSGLNANWYGLLTNTFRKGKDRKTYSTLNVRNPELGGVVGNSIDKHGQPYGLTEEFVEVYRLHSLLPENIEVRTTEDPETIESIPFVQTRQAGSGKLVGRVGMANLFLSFGLQQPGQLVLNNYPNFMREFSIPGTPLFDMAAVDILRARERGVPRYNEFRRQLGLNPIAKFEDLSPDPETVKKLKEVYGDQPGAVEDLDLLVGTLGETQRPTGFGFGETLFQIFILNASRRLQADRFYTDDYNEDVYTPEGMAWIDDVSLKTVILRHYPELAETGLGNIKNAFEPWDTSEDLDPARHPLRKWDKDLNPDPWIGDATR